MKINPKKLQKYEIKEQIQKIFSNHPSKKEIRKAKILAMSKNIKLTSYKKKFCKKCFNFFTPNNSEIRIKKGFKIIRCKKCGYIGRYRMR